MTSSEQSYSDDCDVQVAIGEDSQSIRVRRGGLDESPGIWLKPERLDGDGEMYITLGKLVYALKVLGWNHADIYELMEGSGS